MEIKKHRASHGEMARPPRRHAFRRKLASSCPPPPIRRALCFGPCNGDSAATRQGSRNPGYGIRLSAPLTPPHFLPVPRSPSPDVIPGPWSSAPRLTDPHLGGRGPLWALANTPPPPQPVLAETPAVGRARRQAWAVGAESFHRRPQGLCKYPINVGGTSQ